MEFSFKLHTIKSGWSIIYTEGVTSFKLIKNTVFLSLKIDFFVLANSVDPDEMLPYVAFHQGLHCLL